MQQVDRELFGQESLATVIVDLDDVDVGSRTNDGLHVTFQVLESLGLLLLVFFAVVIQPELHCTDVIEISQFNLDVIHQMLREHVLREFSKQIIVGVLDELAQVARQLHRPQVEVVQRLQVLGIVFAVVGKLGAHVLMDSKLINVEDELRDDLIGAGEHLLDDGVVLPAKWNDSLKHVLASNVAGLQRKLCQAVSQNEINDLQLGSARYKHRRIGSNL